MKNSRLRVAVIGGNSCPPDIYEIAYELGNRLGREKWLVYNGGKSGVMEAVSRGAIEEGGTVVGILPENDTSEMNPFITIPVCTGVGLGRNVILVQSADVVIAVNGKFGTLSEIALALQLGKPVIGIKTWDVDDSIIQVNSPEEAVIEIKKMTGE